MSYKDAKQEEGSLDHWYYYEWHAFRAIWSAFIVLWSVTWNNKKCFSFFFSFLYWNKTYNFWTYKYREKKQYRTTKKGFGSVIWSVVFCFVSPFLLSKCVNWSFTYISRENQTSWAFSHLHRFNCIRASHWFDFSWKTNINLTQKKQSLWDVLLNGPLVT